MSVARHMCASVWYNGSIYVFGGYDSSNTDTILRYTPGVGTIVAGHLVATVSHAAAAVDPLTGRAYVFGGYANGTVLPRVQTIALSGGDATPVLRVTSMTPLAGAAAAWDPRPTLACPTGCAYALGGDAGSYAPSDAIVRYDPVSDTAQTLGSELPSGRLRHAAVFDGAFVYTLGGDVAASPAGSTRTNETVRFDPITGLVESFTTPRLPKPVSHISAALIGPTAYVYGGSSHIQPGLLSDIVRVGPFPGLGDAHGILTELVGSSAEETRSHATTEADRVIATVADDGEATRGEIASARSSIMGAIGSLSGWLSEKLASIHARFDEAEAELADFRMHADARLDGIDADIAALGDQVGEEFDATSVKLDDLASDMGTGFDDTGAQLAELHSHADDRFAAAEGTHDVILSALGATTASTPLAIELTRADLTTWYALVTLAGVPVDAQVTATRGQNASLAIAELEPGLYLVDASAAPLSMASLPFIVRAESDGHAGSALLLVAPGVGRALEPSTATARAG